MLRRFDRCRLRGSLRHAGLVAAVTVTGALGLAGTASAEMGGSWTSGTPLPAATGFAASATLTNGDVLVAGGFGADGNPAGTTALYDPSTDGWTTGPALTPARADAAAVTLANGDVLIAGGVTGTTDLTGLSSGEVYDPSTGTMTAVSNDMSSVRASPVAVLLSNGDVLIAGGTDGSEASETADLYDPTTNAFMPVNSLMSAGRDYPAAALLSDGDVLVAGGAVGTDQDDAGADVFDPQTETFTQVSNDMSVARAGEGMAALSDGDAIVFGGIDGDSTTATSDVYDPGTNRFVPGPAMPVATGLFGSATLTDGNVLVAGGVVQDAGTQSLTAASEEYDPVTNSWTAVGALPDAVDADIVAALPNDQALEAGGGDATSGGGAVTSTDSTAIFTVAAGTGVGGTVGVGPTGGSGDTPPPTTTAGTGGLTTQFTVLPDTPPTIRLTGLKTRLTRAALLRGLRFSVKPSKAASLQIRLVTKGGHAASRGAALATRSYRLSAAGHKVTLVPNRRRVTRHPGRIELIVVATDRSGARRTVTRTVTIRG